MNREGGLAIKIVVGMGFFEETERCIALVAAGNILSATALKHLDYSATNGQAQKDRKGCNGCEQSEAERPKQLTMENGR